MAADLDGVDRTQARTDRYKRFLRYVTKKRTDIGKTQLKRGNATLYIYNKKPFDRVKPYRAAQKQAKRTKRGFWQTCR